jgi:hypothetical protein
LEELLFIESVWFGVTNLDKLFPSFSVGCNSLRSTSFLSIILLSKVLFAQIPLASRIFAFGLSLPTNATIASTVLSGKPKSSQTVLRIILITLVLVEGSGMWLARPWWVIILIVGVFVFVLRNETRLSEASHAPN